MTQLADHDARERIAHDLDTTLVVEAAAGTGKTTALVGRILGLVRTGRTRLAKVVAVTFTEKAAGEMKIRMRTEIEAARQEASGDEAARLDVALKELEAARIGTIHGLCSDILRERPVEAGIDPMFDVAAEGEAEALFSEAFERWFPEVLEDPPEGVRRIMRRPSGRYSSARDQLRGAGWRLAEHRDFTGTWRRDHFARADAIDDLLDQMGDLVALDDQITDRDHHLTRCIGRIGRFVEDLRLKETAFDRDHDAIEASLRSARRWNEWNWRGYNVKELAPGLSRDDVLERRDGLKEILDRVVDACDADLAACLHRELRPLVAEYEALKKRAGKLDFIDLLCRARDLLRDDEGVRAELRERFSHVLVDEFQDTDPLQVELVMMLTSGVPGKAFVVGDPKQSIYRFRRADIAIYEAAKQRFVDEGADVLELSTSFRSDPRIQEAVNGAFTPAMQGGTQASYVPLRPFREADERRPAVVTVPVPAPYGKFGKVWNNAIDKSLPGAVAGWIDWLLRESGWEVQDIDTGEQRGVRSSDVCLLFKRFNKWFGEQATTPYARSLEARDIPHVLVGGRTLHDREEVLAVRNALTAIEWPNDQLSVFATLKGPLFAVPDDALLAWKAAIGPINPLLVPDDVGSLSAVLREVGEAMMVLKQLHRGRNRRPIADTIGLLLESTRAHAGLANWTAGDQVLANVLRMTELGRRFESSHHATSFRAFVEHLTEEAESGASAQALVVEEGTEGVRLMTVHKAKGLQFPVVVLCDMTALEVGRNPSRHADPDLNAWYAPIAGCVPIELLEAASEVLDRDREESHRLLYVAATRARDVLVVPGVGDEARDGWVSLLNPAIYPGRNAGQKSTDAPGCPAFGSDTVADRGNARAPSASVRPGLHTSQVGSAVVWWDPTVLPTSGQSAHGLRRHWLLSPDPDTGRAERGIRDHEAWETARRERITGASKPTLTVFTSREKAETPTAGLAPMPLEQTTVVRAGRPSGKRFGALVHGAIATVPLNADAAAIEAAVAVNARLVGAPDEEASAAVEAVTAALTHPLMVQAFGAEELRREESLTVVADGELVEGTLDLCFLDGGRWTVVELKTSLNTPEERAAAEEQLRWYVRAVSTATGAPADGVVLMV
ncbi:MAG: UvrD-helicase domain-containing protein [Proteobacteria bacterium]|nr:UvrD-helicase domain-containing protein [Pseudomonadota bacterium]